MAHTQGLHAVRASSMPMFKILHIVEWQYDMKGFIHFENEHTHTHTHTFWQHILSNISTPYWHPIFSIIYSLGDAIHSNRSGVLEQLEEHF